MIEKKETIKRLSEENNELIKKATLLDVELKSAREENDNLKETINSSSLPKDEIIKRSMKMREEATARKNQVEIELAKTRIEVMHINSQLMESVQQKVELSQQLEQWQVSIDCPLFVHSLFLLSLSFSFLSPFSLFFSPFVRCPVSILVTFDGTLSLHSSIRLQSVDSKN